MIDFGVIAYKVSKALDTFNYVVTMYDGKGMKVLDVKEARRFYSNGKDIGVYIIEQGESSFINMEIGNSIPINEVSGLRRALQKIVRPNNMTFKMLETHGPIQAQDHASDVMSENRENNMDLSESMYGTSRSSYLKMEGAKLIVKHSSKVDETVTGARSRRIDRMYVENSRGERHLLPTKQLLAGKAMARHVSNDGELGDDVGTKLCEMAEDYSNLGAGIRHIRKNKDILTEDATALQECAAKGRGKIRSLFEKIHRNYFAGVDALTNEPLNEASDEEMDSARGHVSKSLYCDDCQLDEAVVESMARFSFDLTKPPVEEDKPEAPVANDEMRNPVIREYIEWLESFTLENALMEKRDCDVECDDEDSDLSREDILMPSSKKADLKREISRTKPTDKKSNAVLLDDTK